MSSIKIDEILVLDQDGNLKHGVSKEALKSIDLALEHVARVRALELATISDGTKADSEREIDEHITESLNKYLSKYSEMPKKELFLIMLKESLSCVSEEEIKDRFGND